MSELFSKRQSMFSDELYAQSSQGGNVRRFTSRDVDNCAEQAICFRAAVSLYSALWRCALAAGRGQSAESGRREGFRCWRTERKRSGFDGKMEKIRIVKRYAVGHEENYLSRSHRKCEQMKNPDQLVADSMTSLFGSLGMAFRNPLAATTAKPTRREAYRIEGKVTWADDGTPVVGVSLGLGERN